MQNEIDQERIVSHSRVTFLFSFIVQNPHSYASAITINEAEPRLMDDVRQFLRKLAPPEYPYLHNDLHLREAPDGWPGGWEAWAAQEPENCHSHLLSMLLGNSETVPVVDGELTIGTWQSVMLVELDGPRKRTVGVQVVGQRK